MKIKIMRDHSKYRFDGKVHKKGKLVNAVLKYYVVQHPNKTYADLKNDFPDEIQGGVYGVLMKKEEAELKNTKTHKRFLVELDESIILKDAIVTTCTQWNFKNIFQFIKHSRKLGLVIDFEKLYHPQAETILWQASMEKDVLKTLEFFEENNPKYAVDIIMLPNFPKQKRSNYILLIKKGKTHFPELLKHI